MAHIKGLKLFPSGSGLLADIAALAVWAYGLCKLIIFDLDRWIVSLVDPSLEWVVNLRLLVFAFAILTLAIILKPKRFAIFVYYVIGFPFVVIFWKVPIVLIWIGSWVAGIAFVNGILSLFTDMIYKIAYFCAAGTSICLIYLSNSIVANAIGLIILSFVVTASYVKAFVNAYRTPRVLKVYKVVFDTLNAIYIRPDKDVTPIGKKVTQMDGDISKYSNRLQNQVLANRACLFFARRLKEYQDSELSVISGIISTFWLLIVTWIAFAILYFAASKIEPASLAGVSSTFEYLQLSFDSMIFGGSSGDKAVGVWPQALSMYQRFLSLLIVAIFLTIVLEVRKRKHSKEIEDTVAAIKESGKAIEAVVSKEFGYADIDDAIADLERIRGSFHGFIVRLSNSL